MIQPNKKTLEALVTLEHNGHFQAIMQWLEESLADTSSRLLIEKCDIECRNLQGDGRTLQEIIMIAKDARNKIR